ncbi:MAG: PASTA domain-containing protein [Mailhella sp.]|nr:PASTA domain-containing protein [Mailhella sp.]
MRPNSSSSSPRLPGRPRANRRISTVQPSVPSDKGLFSRIRGFWNKVKAQRFHYGAFFFAFVWLLLWLRAFHIQVIDGPTFKAMADSQLSYTETVHGARGSILDRHGRILARSVPCRSISANPRMLEDIDDAAARLAPILKRPASELKALFRKNRAFVWLARKVDDATAAAISKENIRGINLTREYERVYPYRHLAGQLLGFVGMDSRGLEGVERAFDEKLRGSEATSRVSRIAAQRVLNQEEDLLEESQGEDITLTIDVQVQFIAEDVISQAVESAGARWGGVLVSDVESGEVLAWAQYPFFNPNSYRGASPSIYRNRLAGDSLEPGSTMKPLVMAAALEEKLVTPNRKIYCEKGTWRTRYVTIRDDTHSFENLTCTELISKSSNIGMAKIGLEMGAEKLHSYLARLGFGKKTGIGVHESRGILRRPRTWSEVDLMSASFGQSVSVTGIQMLQAYTILADGGEFRPLRLVLDDAGVDSSSSAGQRIFSEKNSRATLRMMEETVDGDGTGSRARIPGLRVAGKTGTAQKADPSGKGYSRKRLASFGGMVPADKPRYVIYVMLDEPTTTGYGGAIAAPVFQKVATRTLAFSGDLPANTADLQEKGKKAKEKARKLTPAQLAQKKKDEIYLANLAKYRAAQAKKAQELEEKENAEKRDLNSRDVMPDLVGLSLRRTIEICAQRGIIPSIQDAGAFVFKQSPAPGTKLSEHSRCTVWLTDIPPVDEAEDKTEKE